MSIMTPEVYWTIFPDWQTVSFSHIWMTGIMTSLNNKEQRSAYLTWPRKRIKFSSFLSNYKESAWVSRKLFHKQANLWGIPIWQDVTSLREAASATDSILYVTDTSKRHFAAGKECIIISETDCMKFDVGTISVLGAEQINLVGHVLNDWPSGSLIFPVLPAMIDAEQKTQMITAAVGVITIDAKEQFTTEE